MVYLIPCMYILRETTNYLSQLKKKYDVIVRKKFSFRFNSRSTDSKDSSFNCLCVFVFCDLWGQKFL